MLKGQAIRWDNVKLKGAECEFCEDAAEHYLVAQHLFARRGALVCGSHFRMWVANRLNL